MKMLSILVLVGAYAAQALGEAVKSLRLILPPKPGPAVENIGRVFARQVEGRCDAKGVLKDDAPLTVELAIEPGVGAEGFRITDSGLRAVRIIGNDVRGLLYGVGKFLHTSAYGDDGFAPGSWRGVSVPRIPVRGIYLATHFQNYSEGIYEDLNKVICTRLYWDSDRPARETVKDYIAFEFAPAVVEEVASVVEMFEKNHRRDQIGERAVEACALLDQPEAKLTPQARRSWRWRLFRIRASLDQELHRNRLGQGRQEVFRQAHEELLKITRAENAWPMLRPVLIPAVSRKK